MSAADLIEMREGHRLSVELVESSLRARICGFQGPLTIRQFAGGQSNPTYLLSTPGADYVLRKKPSGSLLPGAHLIEREFRVMSALSEVGIPVPKMYFLCEDLSITGTAFYVMEHVKGRVMRDATVSGAQPAARAAIYDSMNAAAAALHSVDWQRAGLSDFGKHNSYIARQIGVWTRQYQASQTHPIPAMDRLIAWLPDNIPTEDETRVTHGDYRLENLILHPQENRVIAILDWELSTLGHPLCDMAHNCMVYHVPPSMPGIRGIAGLDLDTLGIPSERAYMEAYCRRTGRESISSWDFYLAFSMFRSAAILQGVYARALQKNASNADALTVGKAAAPLAEIAWSQVARRA
jgi:aminoglycoside phosphotransferase (APT) family kinase protein